MTLTLALKINVKVDWSPLHVSQNCHIVRYVYQLSTELFSHNNHVSMDTFSHEQLYSAHTEMSRPVVKHFSTNTIVGIRRTMSDEIAQVSPKITYVGTMLKSRTRQPTHQIWPPLHILGQQDVVWCGILAPKTLQALVVDCFRRKGADFSAPNSAYCWSD